MKKKGGIFQPTFSRFLLMTDEKWNFTDGWRGEVVMRKIVFSLRVSGESAIFFWRGEAGNRERKQGRVKL